MNKETLNASKDLIKGLYEDVYTYLFETTDWYDKLDLIDDIDDAIEELESWKKAIRELKINEVKNKQ